MTRILIVDDDMFFRKVITGLLTGHGYDITAAEGGEEALEILKTKRFDLMISDVNMTPMDGMELLEKSHEAYTDMGVIMLTGHDEVEVAVDAMKKGAFDFLVKPFHVDELFATVQRSLLYYNASPNNNPIGEKVSLLEGLVTESGAMKKMCETIRRVAPASIAVLLCGEKGIDYELIARTIHYYSLRKDEPFIVFDCAVRPAELIGQELFGGAAGQLDAAKGGTLFIDTIYAMPLEVQAELLNVIQVKNGSQTDGSGDAQMDVRMVVASSKKLDQLVKQGLFSENLYYRLSALHIDVPPLNKRLEDVPFLVDRAIRENMEPGADVPVIDLDVKNILYSYTWPGNQKELSNTIQQLLSLVQNGAITKEMLSGEIIEAAGAGKPDAGREHLKGQSFSAFWRDKQKQLFGGAKA